ncbi:MAG: superinfection immunity protein [Sphingobacteriales bacterium]|nr:superinfection immunity protein [Sphingobacteriales bacterium]
MELWFIFLALVIYFTPTVLGWSKRNAAAIFALNLFLGWTFIGWVFALVWSLKTDD